MKQKIIVTFMCDVIKKIRTQLVINIMGGEEKERIAQIVNVRDGWDIFLNSTHEIFYIFYLNYMTYHDNEIKNYISPSLFHGEE